MLGGERGDAPVPVGDGRLDSNVPVGSEVPVPDNKPPVTETPAETAQDSCSDPMHGDRYTLCSEATPSPSAGGGLRLESTLGSEYEELRGLKYRVRGWSLHAIQ